MKHPDNPWYVVCVQALRQNRQPLGRYQRFTLSVETRDAVYEAYRTFQANREKWRLTHLEEVNETSDDAFFLFSDLNKNWWEITARKDNFDCNT